MSPTEAERRKAESEQDEFTWNGVGVDRTQPREADVDDARLPIPRQGHFVVHCTRVKSRVPRSSGATGHWEHRDRNPSMVMVQQVRVQDLSVSPTLTALCAGYETGSWRTPELVDDVFQRHLPSFALSFTDWNGINGDTAAKMLKKAAESVYSTQKYRRRGEFGELLLHAAVKDFFDAQPAVSKIHFKDSGNDTVKGFDCVHIIEHDGEIELWLGEVKFYKNLTKAIADSTDELKDHLAKDFLRREFVAITNKLDPQWPHAAKVSSLLDNARSLDEILSHLVIPVMLTYDSHAVNAHTVVDDVYIAELTLEVNKALQDFRDKLQVPYPVTLHLILAPLHDKDRLTNLFHQKLQVWKHL